MWKETNSGLARDILSTQYHAVERERGKYWKKERKGNTKTRQWSPVQGWLLRNKLTAGPGWHRRARLRKWLMEDLTRFKQAHDDPHPRNTIFRNVSFLFLPKIMGGGEVVFSHFLRNNYVWVSMWLWGGCWGGVCRTCTHFSVLAIFKIVGNRHLHFISSNVFQSRPDGVPGTWSI